MVAFQQAVQQHACSVAAMQHAVQHAAQHAVHSAVHHDSFIHALQAHVAALTGQLYALQMQNEQLNRENFSLRYLVAENKPSEPVLDFGWQEQLSQSSSVDDAPESEMESESEPEIIEIIDDEVAKADLPPSVPACEDIVICDSSMGGKASIRVQWNIKLFSERMNRARGRPLVSPDFSAGKLVGLRLSVAPDPQNSTVSKDERSLQAFKKLVTTGPFNGCLTLKSQNTPESALEYCVFVNHHAKGPFTNDFREQCSATYDCFGEDWLEGKNKDGSLSVGVEIILPCTDQGSQITDAL